MAISRRWVLRLGAGAGVVGALGVSLWARRGGSARAEGAVFEVVHTEEEWRRLLTRNQFAVLREAATERPYSSPLNDEHRTGVFHCAGCDLPLFDSETKFESHTGWPSFYQPLVDAVGTERDTSYGMVRTSVHCRRCGGHLGHVFDDGPRPTGLRYCMNGLALKFVPA